MSVYFKLITYHDEKIGNLGAIYCLRGSRALVALVAVAGHGVRYVPHSVRFDDACISGRR